MTLENLEKGGFLPKQRASVWTQIRKQFHLLVDDKDTDKDISYAYSGYAPLSIRLVEQLKLPQGWRMIQEELNLLWGPVLEMEQASDSKDECEVVLVFFLGGVTRAEIAALRKTEECEQGRRRFLIATTEFWTSRRCFSQMEQWKSEIREEKPEASLKKGWFR